MPTTDPATRPGERALAAAASAGAAVLSVCLVLSGAPVTAGIGAAAAWLLYRHARQQ